MTSRTRFSLLGLFGTLLVGVAAIGVGYPLWWNHRSATGGAALLARAVAMNAPIGNASSAPCPMGYSAASAASGSDPGILEIPAIGLVAPVLNGLSDAVLNVAVGHVIGTPWPGNAGESIVEAHDVSYFTNVGKLRAGDEVLWITRCARSEFTVLGTSIHEPGALLYPPSTGPGLALVTCYPTDALFWTNERYVVATELVSSTVSQQNVPAASNLGVPQLKVPAPPALVAEGLALDQNSLLLGVLRVTGSPDALWTSGPAPLDVEADALAVFFGAEKAVAQNNRSWWSDLTLSGVPFHALPSFGQTNVTISVQGAVPSNVTFTSGAASVTVVNKQGTLYISQISP